MLHPSAFYREGGSANLGVPLSRLRLHRLQLQHVVDLELPETLVLNDNQLVIQACIAGEGIALGWSFTTSHLVEQGTLMRPLDHVAATEFAFYVIGGEAANFTKDKLRFINWIMP